MILQEFAFITPNSVGGGNGNIEQSWSRRWNRTWFRYCTRSSSFCPNEEAVPQTLNDNVK